MKLFAEKSIISLFEGNDKSLNNWTSKISDDDIMKQDSMKFSKNIAEKYKINFDVEIDFENGTNSIRKESVGSQRNINPYTTSYIVVVDYFFPVNGNISLLQYAPYKEHARWTLKNNWVDGILKDNRLIIPISTDYANENLPDHIVERVNKRILAMRASITSIVQEMKNESEEYNESLYDRVFASIEEDKKRITREQEQRNKLNPFKKQF